MGKDVIAAIATPTAAKMAAIGIVRLSGEGSFGILQKLLRPRRRRLESHRMLHGRIVSGAEALDEVLACPMRAPRTYTGEDTVEIYAHGGLYVLKSVLGAVLESGARQAGPGEFSQRAFLNGRLSLNEAEAVMDLISATSEAARREGMRQLGGSLSAKIAALRGRLLGLIARIELGVDYPEHEDGAACLQELAREAPLLAAELAGLLRTAGAGRIIRDGARAAIVGKPNAGKSTLFNCLLAEERAIVHDAPGTTRDVLSEVARLGGFALALSDTAGMRAAEDAVEKMGIERARAAAAGADLVLYVADATLGLDDEDRGNLRALGGGALVVYGKSDLPGAKPPPPGAVAVSAKTGQGMGRLAAEMEARISAKIEAGAGGPREAPVLTRERHRLLVAGALSHVERAAGELAAGVHEDIVSIGLRAAYDELGRILGAEAGDDIAEKIFSEFCVGK